MARRVRISAISVATIEGMVRENYARALRLGEIALAGSPDILLFPEMLAAGYCATDLSPYAETLDDPYPRRFRELSSAGGCVVAFGFLRRVPGGVANTVAVFDHGNLVGTHDKRTLWPDDDRPYRDERKLLVPGEKMEVFDTRLGKFAVLICYENWPAANWDEVAGQADFVLSAYNCQGDPSHRNIDEAKRLGLPSAWADRTGTVYAGDHYKPNLGTAGLVSAEGKVIAQSQPGVETIITGELHVGG